MEFSKGKLSMNAYGNTCPMCCGDLDDVAYLRTGANVCLSCGCKAEAAASATLMARSPDVMAFNMSTIAMSDPAIPQAPSGWISPAPDIQLQTAGGTALPK